MKCILYLPQIWKRGSETKQAGKKATWIKANGSAPQISQKSPCIGLVLPLPKLCIFSLINKKKKEIEKWLLTQHLLNQSM